MKSARKVVGKLVSTYTTWLYRWRQRTGKPIRYSLSRNATFYLYPVGHIAELLFTSLYFYPMGQIADFLGTRGFEHTELSLTIALLRKGMHVVDIGANIGLYSIVADKIVGSTGKVWAFEPSLQTYGNFVKNLSLNECVSVTPVQVALSHQVGGSSTLRRDPGFRDGDCYLLPQESNTSSSPTAKHDFGDSESVLVTTLDNYFEAHGMPRVDFLKMDVEGGELAVFKGATKMLTMSSDIVLLFECTPPFCERYGHRPEDVFELLHELGFGLYCWKSESREWETSTESLVGAGNIWACRDVNRLPSL